MTHVIHNDSVIILFRNGGSVVVVVVETLHCNPCVRNVCVRNVRVRNVRAPNVCVPNVCAPNVHAPNVYVPNIYAPNIFISCTHRLFTYPPFYIMQPTFVFFPVRDRLYGSQSRLYFRYTNGFRITIAQSNAHQINGWWQLTDVDGTCTYCFAGYNFFAE